MSTLNKKRKVLSTAKKLPSTKKSKQSDVASGSAVLQKLPPLPANFNPRYSLGFFYSWKYKEVQDKHPCEWLEANKNMYKKLLDFYTLEFTGKEKKRTMNRFSQYCITHHPSIVILTYYGEKEQDISLLLSEVLNPNLLVQL
jgi:hypothetical protein